MHSYWERDQWFNSIDFTIIGSGIVGINCALALRSKHPNSKICILEQGYIPSGASTKNAGFACFGSPSELLSDIKNTSKDDVFRLVERRVKGLETLKSICGAEVMDFQQNGSHELFGLKERMLYQECSDEISELNNLLKPIFNENCFIHSDSEISNFGYEKVEHMIFNKFEGQIDTGKMGHRLLELCNFKNIRIFNGCEVTQVEEFINKATVHLKNKFSFDTQHAFVATNGFAANLYKELDVAPARAQVLITKPIKNLRIKGTFHLEEGYYYFRNINDRILFGGGRNLDIKGETTTELTTSELIQGKLDQILKDVILPNTEFEVENRWAGVMGVGATKSPILESYSNHVHVGVRLGGMGVALGSLVGQELAALID